MFLEDSPTLALAKQLIERPSVTPEDAGCQLILSERLEKLGFTIQSLPFADVKNLWAVRGTHKPLLAFVGHTDVVPPGDLSLWETDPFTPTVKGEYLYGRGTADMKGSIAAMITAVTHFLDEHPTHAGSIAFLITSDEEGRAENGTKKVMEYLNQHNIQIDYALVGEPSSHKILGDTIKNGRRGSLNCYLKVLGVQGHIAYPHLADNAIHRALMPLQALTETTWDQGSSFFPPTSFQIANIQAGTGATNVIPGNLECQFNFRFNNEVTPEVLLNKTRKTLDSFHLQYSLDYHLSGLPFLTKSGPLVSSCVSAIQAITEITPDLSTSGGTSDGRFIAPCGAEVIEFGPCNTTIHAVNECVRVEDLENLAKIYQQILTQIFSA
jgi:succinyl-diaminopimelate desuccinylase